MFFKTDKAAQVQEVHDAVSKGASVAINQFHDRWAAAAGIVASFEQALWTFVNANMYLTPPGKAGLSPHYDVRDVFVVQLEGRKHWKMWEPVSKLPVERAEITPQVCVCVCLQRA